MKKVMIIAAIATMGVSCNKECTCELNTYLDGTLMVNNSYQVTGDGLCKEEGSSTTLTNGSVTIETVYENCSKN